MLTIEQTEGKLRNELEKTYKKPGRGSTSSLEYLRAGAVALAMNEAFGPCGWDALLDKVEIIKSAYKIAPNGAEDTNGAYWNAIAYAIVTVKARSLFKQDGTYVEVTRQDVGLGSAVGGKQKTAVDAIQNALTTAVTNAFKRACRFFGPKTGLTLQFEPGERESIQRQLDAMRHLQEVDGGAAGIEGGTTEEEASSLTVAADLMDGSAQTQTTAGDPQPETQTSAATASAVVSSNGADGTEVLASFVAADLLGRIRALESPDTAVPLDDVKAFHKSMAGTFGPHEAVGIWATAGVTLGPGAVVKRRDIFGVAQVLEEAHAGEGGLDAFLSQFRPAKPPAAAQTAVASTQTAPTTPAPAAASATPAPATPTPAATAQSAEAPQTHGEQVQQAWDESAIGQADRRKRYEKLFATRAPEVVDLLATTPDDKEVTAIDAAKLHGVALKIIQEMNVPSADVYSYWAKANFKFGNGQPRGRHIRAFADALPQ
jgi:cell division septation protein DedD